MAIEFIDGFEVGLTGSAPSPEWSTFTGLVYSAATRFSSGRAVTASGAGGSCVMALALPATTRKTVGFAYKADATTLGQTNSRVLQLFTDTLTATQLTVWFDASNHIVIRRGTTAGTLIATSTQTFTPNTWRYIEVQATIDATVGTCIVRVDGVVWINFTGNTQNVASPGASKIDGLVFSFGSNTTASTSNGYDDLYVCNEVNDLGNTGRADNTFLGDCRIDGLLPNADGASSQWVPSTGTSHFALVDDPAGSPNSTDYVGSATIGDRDLWALPDLSVGARVLATRTAVYAAKSDAGSASVKQLTRDASGTVTADAAQPLGASWLMYWGTVHAARPSGGAWTQADANAMQIGAERGA